MDVEAENKKLDTYEEKYLESHEKIKELIASSNSSYKEIKIGDSSIRIKSRMPKSVRLLSVKIGKQLENADENTFQEVEEKLYGLVASMCIDEPYTHRETWAYIDDKTGGIQEALLLILSEVNKVDVDLKSFRGKR